jgi:papain like protease
MQALAIVLLTLLAGCVRSADQSPSMFVAMGGPPRCEPVEVGPGKWITPMCGELPVAQTTPRAAWGIDGAGGGGLFLAPAPPEVDLRPWDGPVRDQGQVGVCWAFALSSVMDNGARHGGDGQAMMSSLHVIASDTWDDVWQRKEGKPLTLEGIWPYEPRKACAFNDDPQEEWCQEKYGVRPGSWRSDPRLVAERQMADDAHRYRFRNVRHVSTKPVSIDEIASVLASGHVAWEWRALRDGVFSDYEQAGSFGHAVQITGYRTAGGIKHFLLKNSWGTAWGQGGYAWMGENIVRRHLRRAFFLDVAASQAGAHPPIAGLPGLPEIPGLKLPWALPTTSPATPSSPAGWIPVLPSNVLPPPGGSGGTCVLGVCLP